MTQFQPAESPGHHPGWCVGDKRGHPQPVGVGEPQLRSRMRAYLAQDEPGPDGPAAQIDQIGGLGDPGTLADAAAISSSYTSAWPPKQRSESNYAKHAAPWRRAETNQPSRADTMRQLCRGTPVNYVVKPDTRTGTQGVCAGEKHLLNLSGELQQALILLLGSLACQLCRGTPVNYVVKPDTPTGTQGVCAEEKTMGRFSFR
jgi:hypothetical protein